MEFTLVKQIKQNNNIMKTSLLISLFCIASIGSYAQDVQKDQSATNNAVCRKYPDMPKGAKPAWPKTTPYVSNVAPQCAPCYTYTRKSGLKVMECPGLWFLPEGAGKDNGNTVQTDGMNVQAQNVYTGNYPKVCKRDPNMPANAVPVWPKGEYTPTQDPACAPCYEYTTKHGLGVMECPYLYFPAEEEKK